MTIYKQFYFDSAHYLPYVPDGHKCKEMHGHTYKLTLYFTGPLDETYGWVIDFNEIKTVVDPLIKTLDHKLLNNIEGLENPTSEVIAMWIWTKLKPGMPLLSKIELNETPSTGAVYSDN